MAFHVIEYDEECPSCKGTGLYVGMCEGDGSAVVCHNCHGTGCHHVKLQYNDFKKRISRSDVKRVYEVNPGICIGENKEVCLEDFGGMSYQSWICKEPFPPRSENRRFTCPAWWYQSANYELKLKWDECVACGTFSGCKYFYNKQRCWERFDAERKNNV